MNMDVLRRYAAEFLQRRAKRLSHITSSFPDQEEDTRNAETTPAHPER
jgi:hypothetical protein